MSKHRYYQKGKEVWLETDAGKHIKKMTCKKAADAKAAVNRANDEIDKLKKDVADLDPKNRKAAERRAKWNQKDLDKKNGK